jgi:flagellar assembly factor FliW
MQITGTRFGQIEIDDARVITLSTGIIGFPQEGQFVLLAPASGSAISWLQSLSTPSLAFPVIEGSSVLPGYTASDIEECARQAAIKPADLSLLVIVRVSRDEPRMVANLVAPIAVDRRARKGTQVVLDWSKFSAATPIQPPVVTAPRGAQSPANANGNTIAATAAGASAE